MNGPPDEPERTWTGGPPALALPDRDARDTPWGSWLLRRWLGAGGMGAVYEAVPQAQPGAPPCALKIVTAAPGSADFEALTRRFTDREAPLAAGIGHPNVIRVYESGVGHDGRPFLAMELLEGGSVSARPERFREFHRAAGVVLGLARALAALHATAICHRDVKPGNLLFRAPDDAPDAVVLTDFGLARGTGDAFTKPQTFVGTFNYASPEQLASTRDADHRTDVYAAGVLLFWLLTGRLPFDPPASKLPSDHRAARLRPLLDLETARPGAPALLGDLCRMCLQPDPAKRELSAADLAHYLETAVERTRPQ